ncbi:hypothetical protein [Providencia huaxiensis]|uniref:hypothetical protein n=1 Tax=Providencia huaxiensis TaxID=2027290 RepID=UPI0034DDC82D
MADQTAKLAQKAALESELAAAKKQLAEHQAAQNALSDSLLTARSSNLRCKRVCRKMNRITLRHRRS